MNKHCSSRKKTSSLPPTLSVSFKTQRCYQCTLVLIVLQTGRRTTQSCITTKSTCRVLTRIGFKSLWCLHCQSISSTTASLSRSGRPVHQPSVFRAKQPEQLLLQTVFSTKNDTRQVLQNLWSLFSKTTSLYSYYLSTRAHTWRCSCRNLEGPRSPQTT